MPTFRVPPAASAPLNSALGVNLSEAKRFTKQCSDDKSGKSSRGHPLARLSLLFIRYCFLPNQSFQYCSKINLPLKVTFTVDLPVEECGRTNLIGKDKIVPQKASPTTDRKFCYRREDNNSKKEEKLCRKGR